MNTPVQKPPELHLWLYDSRPIHSLKVDQVMTGADTADTWVTLVGSAGERRVKWADVQQILEVSVDWSSVARLRSYSTEQVEKWRRFERENAADLKELERLKKKLGLG